jgi:DNA polymerase elongation subunit (family B)
MTENEKILYGFGETQKIVAIQQISSDKMRLYIRDGESVNYVDKKFYPFFFASSDSFLQTFDSKFWKKRLEGDGYYKYIYAFESWSDMYRALRNIARQLNYQKTSFNDLKEIYTRFEPITQFLLQSGETLFNGLKFEDVNILAIKTVIITGENSKSRYKDQLFAFGIADNKGEVEIHYQKSNKITERDLLIKLVEIIQSKNPDLLIGFNSTEEIALLSSRYILHRINFSIGRDNTEPLIDLNNKVQVGTKQIPDVIVSGRHFIDLLQMISHSDTIRREVEDYSQPNIMKYFGIKETFEFAMDDREVVNFVENEKDHSVIVHKIENDLKEILQLSEILLPPYFYQAHFVPMNLIQIIRTGVSLKIELMMVREYLRRRYSLPISQSVQPISGGYTNVFYRGVFENIIHADVESLYPSIIISHKINPASDKLGVFLKLITILTNERLKLKKLKEKTDDLKLKRYYDSMQLSYKILINSFYGYLGYFKALFNDYQKANQVTKSGQELLKKLISEFQEKGCTVIEVDTDGLYLAPQKKLTEEEERKLVEEVNETIPEGINLSYGGRYARMLSYKKKNYALLTYDNKLIIKGSALISRSFENFALNFMRECIELILTDKLEMIPKIYHELRSDIVNLKIDINDLARTEILHDTYEEYEQAVKSGKRQKSAAYELAYKYYGNKFYPGMKITYYITGDDPDVKVFENCELVDFYNPNFPNVNREYYLKKLEEYVSRFQIFFSEEDFKVLFPSEDFNALFQKTTNVSFENKPKVINTKVVEES